MLTLVISVLAIHGEYDVRYRHALALAWLPLLVGCADTHNVSHLALDPNHFTLDTPIEQLAANSSATAVLNKDIPGLLEDNSYSIFKSMSLRQVGALSNGQISSQTLSQAEADLWTISPATTTTILK
jgi:hypothetical protein